MGEGPAAVTGADGVTRRAVEAGHRRLLASIFGTVVVGRCAWRARGRAGVDPAAAALRLPRRRHSHGLRRLAAQGGGARLVRPGDRGDRSPLRAGGRQAAGRAVDRGRRRRHRRVLPGRGGSAVHRRHRAGAQRGRQGRGDASRGAAGGDPEGGPGQGRGHLPDAAASGEQQGRKRMATLGVVDDATPASRRAHDVICVPAATARGPQRPTPPPGRPQRPSQVADRLGHPTRRAGHWGGLRPGHPA